MTSFPYQRPLTLRLWKIKVDCRVQIPQKNFAKGYSPASTSLTLLLCPHPHPFLPAEQKAVFTSLPPPPPTSPPPPEQKAVKCSRWDGSGLLNFELISADQRID